MINPGPNSLSCYYQNVQGLIPFGCLGKSQPSLDRTKIFELNSHINNSRPDIIFLAETWLKRSILDNEIIHDTGYTIFRNDRSQVSHPVDQSNPDKYRKNGGGVLIAVRSDIKAEISRISVRKGAEMVAIEMKIDCQKYIFCVVYRVGTLGTDNHNSIMNTIKAFYTSKRPKKIFIIGDMNLSSVNWSDLCNPTAVDPVDRLFLDTFHEFDLKQCISSPTHNKGRILDILLTNSSSLLQNVEVQDRTCICKSDHFPILFNVKTKISYSKAPKRKIFNFKKADWSSLNRDISRIAWKDLLHSAEPELAWRSFKGILVSLVTKHIPTITIKLGYKSPWFDSESYQSYLIKKRAHEKWKGTNDNLDYFKFSQYRRNFKELSDKKFNDNLYNSDDFSSITKKRNYISLYSF